MKQPKPWTFLPWMSLPSISSAKMYEQSDETSLKAIVLNSVVLEAAAFSVSAEAVQQTQVSDVHTNNSNTQITIGFVIGKRPTWPCDEEGTQKQHPLNKIPLFSTTEQQNMSGTLHWRTSVRKCLCNFWIRVSFVAVQKWSKDSGCLDWETTLLLNTAVWEVPAMGLCIQPWPGQRINL